MSWVLPRYWSLVELFSTHRCSRPVLSFVMQFQLCQQLPDRDSTCLRVDPNLNILFSTGSLIWQCFLDLVFYELCYSLSSDLSLDQCSYTEVRLPHISNCSAMLLLSYLTRSKAKITKSSGHIYSLWEKVGNFCLHLEAYLGSQAQNFIGLDYPNEAILWWQDSQQISSSFWHLVKS